MNFRKKKAKIKNCQNCGKEDSLTEFDTGERTGQNHCQVILSLCQGCYEILSVRQTRDTNHNGILESSFRTFKIPKGRKSRMRNKADY